MSSNYRAWTRMLGPVVGTWAYLVARWPHGVVEVTLPGLRFPVALRSGTSDRLALSQVFADGEYETAARMQPQYIVDGGANVGFASIKFASMYPAATIVAVEPDPTNCELLRRNLSPYRQARVIEAGLWPRPARLVIENPTAEPWAFRVREGRPGESAFDAVSLDGLLEASPSGTIDILKLDVEGTEYDLFSDPGCDRWLSRTNMLFVETHDRFRPGCVAALKAAAERHGFTWAKAGEKVVLARSPSAKDRIG